jgi:hypothetical protein
LAQLIFDKKEDPICISTCVKDLDSICPGRIWSAKREEKSNYCSLFVLVECLCPCHDNYSELLNYEQKEWLIRSMSSLMGQSYKSFQPIELPLKWAEKNRFDIRRF